MLFVVGLGNPGAKYAQTQHNVGFLAVDYLARFWRASSFQSKFQSEFADADLQNHKVFLQKPQTFMNLSGRAVQEAGAFYKINYATELLVISDDLDLPKGRPRLRKEGGSGGHNGLKSLEQSLGTQQFMRLRVGIGRDENAASDSYVLSRMAKDDLILYEKTFEVIRSAIEIFLENGLQKAIEFTNKKWDFVPEQST